MEDRNKDKTPWHFRRKIIVTTLFLCAATVGYVTYNNMDSELGNNLVTSSFTLAGMVIGSYVFGAVWNDKS